MTDFRCKNCGNLLFKESVQIGGVEIKCPYCNTFNYIERITIQSKSKVVWLGGVDTQPEECNNEDDNLERPRGGKD